MYVTPIRLDLLLNTNQISCCKWYVRRFDPDKVENGHMSVSRYTTNVDLVSMIGTTVFKGAECTSGNVKRL